MRFILLDSASHVMVSGDEHEEEDEREEMWEEEEEEEDILGTDDEAPEDTEHDVVSAAAEADAAGSRCRFRGRASNDDKGDVVCAACEVMPGEEAEMETETEVEAGASHVPSVRSCSTRMSTVMGSARTHGGRWRGSRR